MVSVGELIATKAFIILMLVSMAFLLCKTVDSCPIPCSVNAYGNVGRYFSDLRWLQFATTSSRSASVRVNRKLLGNLSELRLACWFKRFVVT